MARFCWNNGHGGSDPGKVAAAGQTEAKTNLNTSNYGMAYHKSKGHQCILTNPKMENMTPGARPRMANSFKAHAYLSVHHNAGRGKYTLIIHQINNPNSKLLAEFIANEFRRQYPGRDIRIGTRESDKYPGKDYFSDLAVATMPAVIIEFCFMDSEIAMIDTLTEQKIEGECIAKGAEKFAAAILKVGQ